MKRFHVHVAVKDLQESIRFYSTLFGAAPTVTQPDYAKWMLDDPRINFAISHRGHSAGINHLGLQVDSAEELTAMREQLQAADAGMVEQTGAACCYARSDKYWVNDPAGIAWETFHSLGAVPVYGEDTQSAADGGACCVPLKAHGEADAKAACCVPNQPARDETKQAACCA
ncbi:MAG TPA: ArsI/CadI family heavy metal resistance metalloenzyme [Burkholderiaceae bacterium]|nr:ArsI/CadI family heavy metal resistance metalloenzyme [Burkholderiaceae bacterium]